MSVPASGAVTVDYQTLDGTATVAGGDYQAAAGTLTFPASVVAQTLTVLVNGDTAVEGTETFTVTLSNPSGALIADAEGVGTILDDDMAPTGADLVVGSFLAPAIASIGGTVDLTVQVQNDGPEPATGVVLVATLPPGIGYLSGPPYCSESMGSITCALGGVAAGSMAEVVLSLEALANGSHSIVSSATANEVDPTPASSTSTIVLTVGSVLEIPTLNALALLLLAACLAAIGWSRVR